jgi:hypothetical protein
MRISGTRSPPGQNRAAHGPKSSMSVPANGTLRESLSKRLSDLTSVPRYYRALFLDRDRQLGQEILQELFSRLSQDAFRMKLNPLNMRIAAMPNSHNDVVGCPGCNL